METKQQSLRMPSDRLTAMNGQTQQRNRNKRAVSFQLFLLHSLPESETISHSKHTKQENFSLLLQLTSENLMENL